MIPVRNLEVHIKAETGFKGGNIKIVKDLAISCVIKRLAPPSLDTCDLEIQNMLAEDTNVLTTLNFDPSKILKNTLEVYGGEDGALTRIFKGDIIRGSTTFGADSKFTASCQTNYFAGIRQMRPVSIKGREEIATLIKKLCEDAGLTFINKGVKGIFLTDVILQGDPISQIIELCEQVDIELTLTDEEVKINTRTYKSNSTIVSLNSSNGMLGFPTVDELGVNITAKFNRNILIGDIIQVESLHTKANGRWKVFECTVAVSNQAEQWEMAIRGRKY